MPSTPSVSMAFLNDVTVWQLDFLLPTSVEVENPFFRRLESVQNQIVKIGYPFVYNSHFVTDNCLNLVGSLSKTRVGFTFAYRV